MTKSLMLPYMGGKMKIVAKGDIYTFDKKESMYDRSKVVLTANKQDVVLEKAAFDALVEALKNNPEVKAKLKDWA